MHVLRDCYFARATWNLLQPGNHVANFFNLNHMDWLIKNLSISGDWAVRFGVMLSSLWYARNKQVFEGKSSNPTGVAEAIKSRTCEFSMVMKASITPKKVGTNRELIRWFPPNEDAIKMNVDGSFFSHTRNASCGGLFCNHLGRFVTGFSCNLGGCSIMQAELWGIIKGLQIAVANKFRWVVIESDSEMAIKFVNNGCSAHHPCAPLLEDIAILVRRIPQVSWNHILREANSAANILAKKGQDLPYGIHVFDAPPPNTIHALSSDAAGSFRLRGCN
ncbi:hypothetical protein Ahy_B05g076024 [Arachis hypogaea]|uniref:RNase H type-1 domain-containing protein n=1 Tax=Arachis hypogaea TaxID=3818 RepID=A0A444Z2E4_ARAHY|nr:hypothetical protein Ahy_B05g076024 [Arachis hypogaea]